MKSRNAMSDARKIGALLCAAFLSIFPGCAPKTIHTAAAPGPANDNSYLDLQPGGHLRILVPTTKSITYQAAPDARQESGNTITLTTASPVGYEVSYYSIERQRHGNVRLRFVSAEMTEDGKTHQEQHAQTLPFALPLQAEHIRLVYLVRSSRADHNMAIAASKKLDELNSFTNRFKDNPDICRSDGSIFCTWVPQGVAVRPE